MGQTPLYHFPSAQLADNQLPVSSECRGVDGIAVVRFFGGSVINILRHIMRTSHTIMLLYG